MKRTSLLILISLGVLLCSCQTGIDRSPGALYHFVEIEGFLDVATANLQERTGSQPIRKFTEDVRLSVEGTPSDEDMAMVKQVVDEFNELLEGKIHITFNYEKPNVLILIGSARDIEKAIEDQVYVWAGFGVIPREDNSIEYAGGMVSTEITLSRKMVIRRALFNCMGLTGSTTVIDTGTCFQPYYNYTLPSSLTVFDRELLKLLYRDEVKPGMKIDELKKLLPTLRRH